MKELLAKMKAQQSIMEKLFEKAEAEDRGFSEDEQKKYDAAKAKLAELNAMYEEAKALDDNSKALADADAAAAAAAAEPAPEPASNANAKANQASAGKNLKSEKTYDNIGAQLIDVARAHVNGDAMERLVNNKLNTETGEDGAFLVVPEFIDSMLETADSQSQLFSQANQLSLTRGNTASIPGVDETSRADGQRFGGLSVDWIREGQEISESQPSFRNVDIKLSKLAGFVAVTSEMLEDAPLLASWIQMAFPAEMSFVLDQAVYDGDGNGKPLGVMKSDALVVVPKESSQVANTVVYKNIIKMWARMPARRASNSAWYVTQQVLEQLPEMNLDVGTGGSAVFIPQGGASVAPYGTLMGRPIVPIEQAVTLGSQGDILLADMSDYIAIVKGGLKADSSIHVEFKKDINSYRFIRRVNGAPYTRTALESRASASFKTSPYITLAERS